MAGTTAVRVLVRAAASARAHGIHTSVSCGKVVQFNLSDIGEGIREVTVRNWYVKENDVVAQFDNICEVESDKATVSITSRFDGRITRLYHEIGDTALVGKPLLDIDTPGEAADEADGEVKDSGDLEASAPATTAHEPSVPKSLENDLYSEETWNKALATPAVRRIAMEYKININEVKGSGKGGRVLKEDILAFVESMKGVEHEPVTTVKPLTTIQRVMTRTMTDSLKVPQFVLSDEIDVSKLVRLRAEAKDIALKKDIKLSYLPFFVKAISKGLSEYPILNSSFDEEREQIVFKQSHNIGIAVDSPAGLLVPNVKDVQKLSVVGIAREINRLQELAMKMKLSPTDLSGGTFSVSNIGTIAGTTATPVILLPEVAIVALGRIQRLPRFDSSGHVVPADIIYISWSADHRIIDGATVARCSQLFRHYVENPSALIMDL